MSYEKQVRDAIETAWSVAESRAVIRSGSRDLTCEEQLNLLFKLAGEFQSQIIFLASKLDEVTDALALRGNGDTDSPSPN